MQACDRQLRGSDGGTRTRETSSLLLAHLPARQTQAYLPATRTRSWRQTGAWLKLCAPKQSEVVLSSPWVETIQWLSAASQVRASCVQAHCFQRTQHSHPPHAGLLQAGRDTSVLWVDAHADINTPDGSPSGNMHGMPVALLMKLVDGASMPGGSWLADVPALDPSRIVYVGLRDVDVFERKMIAKHGIKSFSMREVDKYGIGRVMCVPLMPWWRTLAPSSHPAHCTGRRPWIT